MSEGNWRFLIGAAFLVVSCVLFGIPYFAGGLALGIGITNVICGFLPMFNPLEKGGVSTDRREQK